MSREEHFTQIRNEFLDALCRLRIPGEARQVLDFIIRKTWGWKKAQDAIPLSQFEAGTGLKRSNVVRARDRLIAMNIIFVIKSDTTSIKGDTNQITIYKINDKSNTWKDSVVSKLILPSIEIETSQKRDQGGSIKNPHLLVSEAIPSKETKENLVLNYYIKSSCANSENLHDPPKEEPREILVLEPTPLEIPKAKPDYQFQEFWDLYPQKKAKQKAQSSWLKLKPDKTLVAEILESF